VTVFDYWHERFSLRLFAPVAIAIAASGQAGRLPAPGEFVMDAGFALLLLAQFRLWDDLADVHVDALLHPNRVLVRARQRWPYGALCGALGAANVAVVASRQGSRLALSLLIALSALLAVVYRHARGRSIPVELVRLAKYPAFVLIVAAGRPDGPIEMAVAGAVAAFVVACAYEVWHDPATPLRAFNRSSRCPLP